MSKKSFFLTVVLLGLSPITNTFATYWNELTWDQQDVIIKYNSARQTLSGILDGIESNLMSVSWMDENEDNRLNNPFRNTEEDSFKNIRGVIGNLKSYLDKAMFDPQKHFYIQGVFVNLENNLLQLVSPIEEEYRILQKKPEAITENESHPLMQKAIALKEPIRDLFPQNINTAKQILLPDYAGEKRKLAPQFLDSKENIQREFEERKTLNHSETVMAYGGIIAPNYFDTLRQLLHQLIVLKDEFKAKNKGSIFDLKDILEQQRIIELNMGDKDNFIRAVTNAEPFNSEFELHGTHLKPSEVWGLTYHIINQIYYENPGDIAAQNLASAYFIKLVEQSGYCAVGGVGRNFQMLFAAYDYLINKYNK